MPAQADFTPALGSFGWTGLYDAALALGTRERTWRRALLDLIDPRAGETIVDVGCGTGSLAVALKLRCPSATVIGVDPDPQVLTLAAAKAKAAGVSVEFRRGYARDAATIASAVDVAVSSLVFHQTPVSEKRSGMIAMFGAVAPRGRVVIADYARQSGLMRRLFGIIQAIDGSVNTTPNADGFLEAELSRLAGYEVSAGKAFRTPTGAISLFRVDIGGVLA